MTHTSALDYVASPTKVVVFSFVVAGFSMHSILTNGIDYVAHPRLSRKAFDEVLNYSGKGFECVRACSDRFSCVSSAQLIESISTNFRSGRHGRPVKKKLVSVEHAAKVRQAKREPSSLLPSLASPQIKQE